MTVDNLHRYAVVSSDYTRPFLLGAYPTMERAIKACGGRRDLWDIFEMLPKPPEVDDR
jgi:hypothetical protein